MKPLLSFLILALAFFPAKATTISDLFFVHFEDNTYSDNKIAKPQSPVRKIPEAGQNNNFIISKVNEVPDSIVESFRLATNTWSARIQQGAPIKVALKWQPLDEGVAFIGDAMYRQDKNGSQPISLVAQSNSLYASLPNHMLITLNSNIEWNCSMGSPISSNQMDAYSCALRGIAHGLGFGSSLVKPQSQIKYAGGEPSLFDRAIFGNDQKKLTDFEIGSDDFHNFISRVDLYVFSENYKLYTTDPFIDGVSLSYIDCPGSIMHSGFGCGDILYDIDETTIDILSKIGWKMPQKGGYIKSLNDVVNNNTISPYITNEFCMLGDARELNWSMSVKNDKGKEIVLQESVDEIFEVPPINYDSKYQLNSDGLLEAIIKCSYTQGNERFIANPLELKVDFKPYIKSINNINSSLKN